ncbi:MAG: hypothetical protein ACWA5A_17745 [Marinibacterium sp.]
MDIQDIAWIFAYALAGILAVLGGKIIYMMLTGSMPLRGLFVVPLKAAPTGTGDQMDPERLLLFMATLGGAGYYLALTLGQPLVALTTDTGATRLPDVPREMLVALGGAQSGYVTGKVFRLFQKG